MANNRELYYTQIAQCTHVGRLLVGQAYTVNHHVCSLDRIAHRIYSTACITTSGRKADQLQCCEGMQQKQ